MKTLSLTVDEKEYLTSEPTWINEIAYSEAYSNNLTKH